jgi:hypothetical protein
MNASGRLNTCKSNGIIAILFSGARVSNAYITCLIEEDSLGKLGVILYIVDGWHHLSTKATVL